MTTAADIIDGTFGYRSVELTIPIIDGWPVTLDAKQVGDLAVHHLADEWRVTHVPTLTSFHKAIPKGDWNEAQLLNWCAKVQADKLADWALLRSLTKDNYKGMFEAKRSVLEHCLGVDVI